MCSAESGPGYTLTCLSPDVNFQYQPNTLHSFISLERAMTALQYNPTDMFLRNRERRPVFAPASLRQMSASFRTETKWKALPNLELSCRSCSQWRLYLLVGIEKNFVMQFMRSLLSMWASRRNLSCNLCVVCYQYGPQQEMCHANYAQSAIIVGLKKPRNHTVIPFLGGESHNSTRTQ